MNRAILFAARLVLVMSLVVSAAPLAQAQAPSQPAPPAAPTSEPTPPFGPDWAMVAGFDVFAKKGCGKCHAIRGVGGGPGPDLARIDAAGFYDVGAAMWNHLPRMGARMREAGIERPHLTPREMSNLIAFLFTAQYYDELGDAKAGEKLFVQKGCAACHSLAGRGGKVGPPLDALKRANSPVLVAAAMWNHGPQMAEVMKQKGIARPSFKGKEMVDLIAYVVAVGQDARAETAQVVPGTPERGEKIFAEKHCAGCHAVAGKGPKVGPDLGRPGHHVSLTRFAARMWDHAPAMWAKMKERGLEVPKLTGQDMADVLAYLYVSHYFDRSASAERGQKLVQDRGCLGCHAVRGKGGKAAADFATSSLVGSPSSVLAGMWNHSLLMQASAERQRAGWPELRAQDLADITAYLNSLGKPSPKPRSTKTGS